MGRQRRDCGDRGEVGLTWGRLGDTGETEDRMVGQMRGWEDR